MNTVIQPAMADANETRLFNRDDRGTILGVTAIFLLTLACHLPLLGSAPLGGTEGLRVIPAHDMVRTGDWLLIRLYGQLYLIKPPLHDWLIALSEIVSRTGGNEFVWRLPSVLGAAILNAALYLFGARWFGRIGGIVAGLCGLGLLAMWGQARTADVDSTNTTAAALAALCLIELHFGRPARRWPWIFAAGLAFGTTLMTKGPAGAPLIVGELLYAIFRPAWISRMRASCDSDSVRSSPSPKAPVALQPESPLDPTDVKSLKPSSGWRSGFRESLRIAISPTTWAPLLIGIALFGTYAFAAWWAVQHLHTRPDLSGIREAGATLFPTNRRQIGMALLLPAQLFAFALPVSVALPLVFVRGFRTAIHDSSRGGSANRLELTDALAGSMLVSWVACVMSGMFNPRYGYVTLAPLCLLAGALAASVPYQAKSASSVLRGIVCGCVIVLLGGNLFLAAVTWKAGIGRPQMIAAGALAAVVAFVTFRRLSTRAAWMPAWGLVVLLLLTAVPFAYQFRAERFEHSDYQAAKILRATVGPNAQVLAGEVLHSHPELFWYAGIDAQTCSSFFLPNPRHYPGGYWVVLDQDEYSRWSRMAPDRLSGWKRFTSHKDVGYIAWYAKAAAETQPD
jgi:4-amino-4-deoxy-L-arabinose transferase-like glycosyltransferase